MTEASKGREVPGNFLLWLKGIVLWLTWGVPHSRGTVAEHSFRGLHPNSLGKPENDKLSMLVKTSLFFRGRSDQ